MTPFTIPLQEGIHPLTYNQRATWGHCLKCGAEHGEPCLGIRDPTFTDVHENRFNAAPWRVRIAALP